MPQATSWRPASSPGEEVDVHQPRPIARCAEDTPPPKFPPKIESANAYEDTREGESAARKRLAWTCLVKIRGIVSPVSDDPLSVPGDLVDAAPAQRICGWCRKEIAPGTQPATYGICRRCFLHIELDATRHEEGRA